MVRDRRERILYVRLVFCHHVADLKDFASRLRSFQFGSTSPKKRDGTVRDRREPVSFLDPVYVALVFDFVVVLQRPITFPLLPSHIELVFIPSPLMLSSEGKSTLTIH
jgi:hypothetical protein